MGCVLPHTGVTADGVEYTKSWVLNWDKVAEASWFAVPKIMPVKPVFDARAIVPVLIMFVVTAVETIGDISGVIEGGMDREATDKELSGGVMCDGLGSTLAALFGVLPNTSFSQNVGLVAMTKVVNRIALASGAVFLILCGLIPKLGALISIMPQSVLGGAAVMMFSSIIVSGIQLITKEPLTPRRLTIVSVALGVGYGIRWFRYCAGCDCCHSFKCDSAKRQRKQTVDRYGSRDKSSGVSISKSSKGSSAGTYVTCRGYFFARKLPPFF